MIKSFEDDYSQVLFRIHALEQSKKEYIKRIKTLEMGWHLSSPMARRTS